MDTFSLGQYLREAREAKALTLDGAEQSLRIRRRILEQFEAGEFNIADMSAVQVRGFLRNYARYLGLEEDTVLQFYDGALANAGRRRSRRERKREEEKRAAATGNGSTSVRTAGARATGEVPVATAPVAPRLAEQRPTRRGRSALSRLLILVSALAALSVIAFVVYNLVELPPGLFDAEGEGSSAIMGDLPATLTRTPQPTFTPETTNSSGLPQQVYNGEPILLLVEFRQRTWVRVVVDGAEVYSGLVAPDEIALEYGAGRQLTEVNLTASNAAALVVMYNGEVQPPFGARGQGVEVIFRPEGDIAISASAEILPTAENSPTLQPTLEPLAATLLAEQTPTGTAEVLPPGTPTATILPPLDSAAPAASPTSDLPPLDDLLPLNPTSTPAVGINDADPNAAASVPTTPAVPTLIPPANSASAGGVSGDTSIAAQPTQAVSPLPPLTGETSTPQATLTPSITPTPQATLTGIPTVLLPADALPTEAGVEEPSIGITPIGDGTLTPTGTITTTQTATDDATLTPTLTATLGAVLPPRIAPTNLTPVKPAAGE